MAGLINKTLKIISRTAIAGLIVFELLNEAGILLFSLDFTWLGLSITAIFCWSVIEIISGLLKKSYGAPLAGWTMFIAAGAVYMDALGDILHFYGRFGWYDQFAHFAGGAAVAILAFDIAWRLAQKHKIPLWFSSFFTIAATALFGALYEIEEYLEDYFTGSHRLGNGPDTANDLFLDIIGAIVIILAINAILFFLKNHSNLKAQSAKRLNSKRITRNEATGLKATA
jgi:uncharacterized membrane protein YjdF